MAILLTPIHVPASCVQECVRQAEHKCSNDIQIHNVGPPTLLSKPGGLIYDLQKPEQILVQLNWL